MTTIILDLSPASSSLVRYAENLANKTLRDLLAEWRLSASQISCSSTLYFRC
ncbi:MAG: hypothetical protein ACTS78_00850 [Arsenophonus sp. NC-WZS1-MAG3]